MNSDPFDLSITKDISIPVVDQIVTFTISANQSIKNISFSKDGGISFDNEYSKNFGIKNADLEIALC